MTETESDPIFSSISKCLEAIARGSFVIVVDDIDRENEGDFIGASSLVSRESIALMLGHTSGVICASISRSTSDRLELPLMVPSSSNADPYSTAFTVTCDFKHGTTTGISASDRASTIRALSSSRSSSSDFTRPGHVFPLIAKQGGVLSRGGHTEAAMDLAKLAGAPGEGGVLCEVVDKSTGDMLRLSNGLIDLSKELNLPLTSIDSIQRFRMRRERLISPPHWNINGERNLSSSSSSSLSFGLKFDSLFFENQTISVVVSKSRKRTRSNLDNAGQSASNTLFTDSLIDKVVVKVEFPDVDTLLPSTFETTIANTTLLNEDDSSDGLYIHVIYPGKPFNDTKVASLYSSSYSSQSRRRTVDTSSTFLFPPPEDILQAFKKVSLYDEYSVCDRVSAEIAQVVRCALKVEASKIEVGDELRLSEIQIEPMYDEVASQPKSIALRGSTSAGEGNEGGIDNSVLSYPEDNHLIDNAIATNRWPDVCLELCSGLPLPRLWEHGLKCKI
jgi:3,4-dihydroxy-2-butanone 4-phosphate synthase